MNYVASHISQSKIIFVLELQQLTFHCNASCIVYIWQEIWLFMLDQKVLTIGLDF